MQLPKLVPVRRALVLLTMAAVVAAPAGAGAGAATFPDTIPLPDGWRPEGIAAGRGTSLYVGSIPTGAVWKADARSGRGAVLVEGREGRSAIGIKVDRRDRLFVAGGATGQAFVDDARTGADLASYRLAPEGEATFVNDVVVTSRAAWFTDSQARRLYALPLGRHGRLPDRDEVRTLDLTGGFQLQPGNNLNGIVAAEGGRVLLAVQTNLGKLWRINPRTGATREVDLGGATLEAGDRIAVVLLSGSLDRGRVVAHLPDPDFDVPTTIAFTAGRLYAVNARFGIADPDTAGYDIVRVG